MSIYRCPYIATYTGGKRQDQAIKSTTDAEAPAKPVVILGKP